MDRLDPAGLAPPHGGERSPRPSAPRRLGPSANGSPCDRLFAAILVDDEVEPQVPLPSAIQLDFGARELDGCFDLALALWREGFDRRELAGLSGRLLAAGDLDPADRVLLKQVRAKFKHLRYAHALYGADHRPPAFLDRVTIGMGHIQDACRNGRPAAARVEGALLRLAMTAGPARVLIRQAAHRVPATPAAFRALLMDDVRVLDALRRADRVTGPLFHAARKRIGRQVSFWDTLRTLAPTPERYRLSRALAAVNGLMGDLHDRLVLERGKDRATYRAPFVLPPVIAHRLEALLPRYGAGAA